MKKINFSKILIAVAAGVVLIIILIPPIPFAQSAGGTSVTTPAAIPCGTQKDASGVVSNPCTPCDIFVLIQNLIKLLSASAAIIATLMFMYGDYLMFTPKLTEAKKVLTNTVIGVLLLFGSWLIEDSVLKLVANQGLLSGTPATTKFGFWNQITCKIVKNQGGNESTFNPDAKTGLIVPGSDSNNVANPGDEEVNRVLLAGPYGRSVLVNKPACPFGVPYQQVSGGCTSVAGLPYSTIQNLHVFNQECGCALLLTGGTEAGHLSHGIGDPVVDLNLDTGLRSLLDDNIMPEIQKNGANNKYNIDKICVTAADHKYSYNCGNYNETDPHLHVQFFDKYTKIN